MNDVTKLLASIEGGDPTAADNLLPPVYNELRKLASAILANEKPGQTIQATVLVHEAWLRIGNDREIESEVKKFPVRGWVFFGSLSH